MYLLLMLGKIIEVLKTEMLLLKFLIIGPLIFLLINVNDPLLTYLAKSVSKTNDLILSIKFDRFKICSIKNRMQ